MAFVRVFGTFSKQSKNCGAAKWSEVEFACGCCGFKSLSDHYLRDLSLVASTSTPPRFVTSQLVAACGCYGFKSRSDHCLRDLSLVAPNSTPPHFVTSQLVATWECYGFKSRGICLWWTRIQLQPAL